MSLVSIIGVLTPLMSLIAIAGFILCLISLVKAIRGQRKIPYLSITALVVPIIVIFNSKHLIIYELERSSTDENINVLVTPDLEVDSRMLLRNILANLYQNKGKSGSHPTENKYLLKICQADKCFKIVAAQDSRESSIYWLSYEALVGNLPLGFTKIYDEKI